MCNRRLSESAFGIGSSRDCSTNLFRLTGLSRHLPRVPVEVASSRVDPFSYIIVLTSIILGLGVTRTVRGLGHLLQTRKRRRNYWVHALWMLNLLLIDGVDLVRGLPVAR